MGEEGRWVVSEERGLENGLEVEMVFCGEENGFELSEGDEEELKSMLPRFLAGCFWGWASWAGRWFFLGFELRDVFDALVPLIALMLPCFLRQECDLQTKM